MMQCNYRWWDPVNQPRWPHMIQCPANAEANGFCPAHEDEA